MSDLGGVLERIVRDGEVFEVHLKAPLFNGDKAFVLGCAEFCGSVLGLYDEEYGWPDPIESKSIQSLADLTPGPRRHPFIQSEGRTIAVALHSREYQMIADPSGTS